MVQAKLGLAWYMYSPDQIWPGLAKLRQSQSQRGWKKTVVFGEKNHSIWPSLALGAPITKFHHIYMLCQQTNTKDIAGQEFKASLKQSCAPISFIHQAICSWFERSWWQTSVRVQRPLHPLEREHVQRSTVSSRCRPVGEAQIFGESTISQDIGTSVRSVSPRCDVVT